MNRRIRGIKEKATDIEARGRKLEFLEKRCKKMEITAIDVINI